MHVRSTIIRASRFSEGARLVAILLALALIQLIPATSAQAQICGSGGCSNATDPGARGAPVGAGTYIKGLNSYQKGIEPAMTAFINEVNVVAGGSSVKRVGLGARWDSNNCAGCHAGVAGTTATVAGGSSLASNPLFGVYQLMGAQNTMPYFETASGPTVVARFPYQSDLVTPDGHVHQLFVITGRSDAGTCNIQQPDFNTAGAENNIIFRQTTPFFGGGLMEIIQDSDIIANMNSNLSQKQALGITGHPNYNADDGSITRFGWKAQKRSLMLFAGEAYNIEEGISNEIFPNKTDETPGCTPPFPEGPPNGQGPHGVPDDRSDFADPSTAGYLYPGDPERFGIFGRLLDQPTPSSTCPAGGNCSNGFTQFVNVGCALCHSSPGPGTGSSTFYFVTPASSVSALGGIKVKLGSDLLVHHMGPCDADNVSQGQAGGDEFRTAPLWGVGQRFFFMHDGGMNRHSVSSPTTNIVQAIEDHFCAGNAQYGPSEANSVVTSFNNLTQKNQQDLIDFLRSL